MIKSTRLKSSGGTNLKATAIRRKK